jgi:hypothetical protein
VFILLVPDELAAEIRKWNLVERNWNLYDGWSVRSGTLRAIHDLVADAEEFDDACDLTAYSESDSEHVANVLRPIPPAHFSTASRDERRYGTSWNRPLR